MEKELWRSGHVVLDAMGRGRDGVEVLDADRTTSEGLGMASHFMVSGASRLGSRNSASLSLCWPLSLCNSGQSGGRARVGHLRTGLVSAKGQWGPFLRGVGLCASFDWPRPLQHAPL